MLKIQTKKVVFFYDTYPQIYIKKLFEVLLFLIFQHFDWIIHDDMEFVLFLEGLFQNEISSNVCVTVLARHQLLIIPSLYTKILQ